VTLLVETPPGYEPERRYILDVVVADWLGLDYELRTTERSDVRIATAAEDAAVTLPDVLFATPSDEWLTEASVPTLAALEQDALGTAFFMLTRYEELARADRDLYGRFPAAASAAWQEGCLGRPVVDERVDRLWDALQAAWPRLERRERTYEVVLTHDIDDPLATLQHTPRDVVRQLGGDLVRRRDPRLAVSRVRSLLGDRSHDPNNTFDLLMDVSERQGLRSGFYFLAHRDQVPRAGAYLFEHPWVRSLIGRIARRGHEVGIHPSFPTYRDAALTRQEVERLRRVAEAEGVHQDEWGGRQHYLRWANPDTWRNWEAAGLAYDTTLAYSEAAGFRTGTCHPYRAFDLRERRALDLREEPFQVMDVTLLSSMGLSLDAARETTLAIAAQCRRHRGRLGILWHNNTLLRSAREQQWYASLVEAVA
jgi:Family of unknown function (DUF7033)